MIPGSVNPLLLKKAAAGGYQIERSLRFNTPDSSFLSRTPGTAGNRKTWTWAGWVKLSALGTTRRIFGVSGASDTDLLDCRFETTDKFIIAANTLQWRTTTQVFRDCSSWYHIVIAFDTTLAAANDRIKLYVNGLQVTTFDTLNNPSPNADTGANRTDVHRIGAGYIAANYFSGYLADVHFIDGQALTPSSFTEVSATTGQLVPKAYSGPTPTGNSFWLPFSDNSAATATTLGKDNFNLGNNWSCNNLSIGGSGSYARYLVQTSGNGTFFGPYAAFDGDVNTAGGVTGASGTGVIAFTPASAISASSLRVYLYTGETGNGSPVSISVNGGAFTNCTTLGAANDSTQWVTATSLITGGQITSIAVQRVNMSGFGYNIGAIEVNGSQLIDSSFAGNDSLVDTPTSYGTDTGVGGEVRGNYATLNPLASASGVTLSNGNLEEAMGATYRTNSGTIYVSSGKWYAEMTAGTQSQAGIVRAGAFDPSTRHGYGANQSGGYTYNYYDGQKANNGSGSSYGATYSTGDIIGVAMDLDAGTLTFYKNNTSQGVAFSGLPAGNYTFGGGHASSTGTHWNFGQRPFAYTAPSGFKALCDTNLPAPVVAKPSTVFDTKLYTGNGSAQTISGLGFSPDLVWIKRRDSGLYHFLVDTVRGNTKTLSSNTTDNEAFATETVINSFDSSGFTLNADDGAGYYGWNQNGASQVAWTWDAGTSTDPSNTAGSITSQVRANVSAGFSIVTMTLSGGNTVGHGLGIAPSLIILKKRNGTSGWPVYHSSLGGTNALELNSTNAVATNSGYWNNANPTSTVFTTGSFHVGDYVAYCFAPVAGYSSFGSYTGNGSADGPFVFTGMRPKFVLIKGSSYASNWNLLDGVRDSYNVADKILRPNLNNAEVNSISAGSGFAADFLSNGFKLRASLVDSNSNADTLVYAAFAENPFQYARAR